MDYKKKYKAALDWMRDVYPTLEGAAKEDAEHYFPELKESEDELARKEMLEYCYKRMNNEFPSITIHQVKRWLAWLEKQGEQKSNCGIPSTTKQKLKDSLNNALAVETGESWNEFLDEQKPTAWSEDVEGAISLLKDMAEEQDKDYCPHNANDLRKAAHYLETCRPQSQWRPSEEQMGALRVLSLKCQSQKQFDIIGELIEQLKVLQDDTKSS